MIKNIKLINFKKGITLPEILIALAVTSIVLITGYTLFSTGIRQFTEGINQLEAQKNGRKIISYFKKKISMAVSGIKLSYIGEKAPTGLATGIEFDILTNKAFELNENDLFYKTTTYTYYLSDNKIMLKIDRKKINKVFEMVKTLYFKIYTTKQGNSNIPVIFISVETFAGKQIASYETIIIPTFISNLKASEQMILPIVNSYAIESIH